MKGLWFFVGAMPFTYKLVAAGGLLVAVWGAIELHDYRERQKGAEKATNTIIKNTEKAKDRLNEKANTGELSFDDCIGDGVLWDFAEGRCQSE